MKIKLYKDINGRISSLNGSDKRYTAGKFREGTQP
jgi:hypothetical protein